MKALVLLASLTVVGPVAAAMQLPPVEDLAAEPVEEASEPIVTRSRTYQLFPQTHLYAPYRADLHSPTFGIALLQATSVGVEDSGRSRFQLRLGGRFGLLRSRPHDDPDRGWQLEIIAGFLGQFDIDRSFDNIGWDGYYGLAYSRMLRPDLVFKAALFHNSAHVGDEFAERTGRLRVDYTREELSIGLSFAPGEHWRFYGEAAWGYELRNEEIQEPGRLQLGAEYEAPHTWWDGRLGWYAALDLSALEERDWRLDVAAQWGVAWPTSTRVWRAGIAWYDGRVPLGEFYQIDESYLSLGLWLDV